MLPGMKIGIDLRTGLQRRLSAWKNWDDPSPGDLTYGVELEGSPEMVVRIGSAKLFRSGLWNGNGFSGSQDYMSNPIYDHDFVWNENEAYYIFFLKNKSVMSTIVLNQTQSLSKRVQNDLVQKMELIARFRRVFTGAIELNVGLVLEELFLHSYTNLDVTRGGSGCAMWFGD
ncbi:hypothetical protein V6N12_054538 [Hibiscus sabdariffa]|uniref:S-locus glycoprotein domain-containing protein n=1 Tax=Hibiscus sabdariffa TaxID=183260 RepID=A0ABR2D0R1_9ROSI